MAYLKLHATAIEHPKILRLADKAFRLWIWGLCYCQTHLTDGYVPVEAIPTRLARANGDLVSADFWTPADGGYHVRDYLEWNDSKAVVKQKRDLNRDRQQRWRDTHVTRYDAPPSHAFVTTETETDAVGDPEKGSGEKFADRAGRLLQELYPRWFSKYRNGARLRLVPNPLLFQDALSLVETWDDARLEKIAQVVLTTDEPFIANSDRGFKIFALKASWADDRLRQAERAAV